jgi:transcriptional regulator of acetoin/glycerol metabolism
MLPPKAALEAARLYRSIGAIAPDLLRPEVFRSWERSHLGGADPSRPRADTLSPRDTERLCEQHAALIRAAHPYMQALSHASGGERHAAMLGDARAVVLDVLGDELTVHGPERVPGPGALLDEATGGTNGMGTAIAENTYVEVIGPEHFIDGLQRFTCLGIPLRDGTAATAGVLSVAVRRPGVARRLREIMLCAAHAIEMELLAARLEEDLRRVLMAQGPDTGAFERLLGDILQAQPAVRLRLEFAAEQLSRSRLTLACDLLALAARVLSRFQRHAALWRRLALDEPEASRPLDVDTMVRELVEMLEIEAAVREVEIVVHEVEPVTVEADPHDLSLALFRCLLGAIQAARGGAINVGLRRRPAGWELRVVPAPGPGAAPTSLRPLRLGGDAAS